MSRANKININLDGLQDLKKQLNMGYYTKVGILANGKANEDHEGIDNATLGAVHEFGSLDENIPPRSFLRMPLETKQDELVSMLKSNKVAALIAQGKIKSVFKLLGIKAEEIIQSAFDSGGFGKWTPLKPQTIKRKGSASVLIDTGQLRRSITSEVVKK